MYRVLIGSFIVLTAALPALAGLAIDAATINTPVVVEGGNVEVEMTVTTSGSGGSNDWAGTSVTLNDGVNPTISECVNTPDHTSSGTYPETFSFAAPAPGTYTLSFIATNRDFLGCLPAGTTSAPFDAGQLIVLADSDGDGIADDGDNNGTPGDNPCTGGATADCDDNCVNTPNPNQEDTDNGGAGDGIGDACDCDPDVAGPVFDSPPADQTIPLDAAGHYVLGDFTNQAVTDNCDEPPFVVTQDPLPGGGYDGPQDILVTLTVSDSIPNEATHEFTIHLVVDEKDPDIKCPWFILGELDLDIVQTVTNCQTMTAEELLEQVANGNSGISADDDGDGYGAALDIVNPLPAYDVGIHLIEFQAIDGAGNVSEDTCTMEIVVVQGMECEGAQGPGGPGGPAGPAGPAGATGASGGGGADGIDCWDLNGDGVNDPEEDVNLDGFWDALDCQGPEGPQGAQGLQGDPGPQGPQGSQGEPGAGQPLPTVENDTLCQLCGIGCPQAMAMSVLGLLAMGFVQKRRRF